MKIQALTLALLCDLCQITSVSSSIKSENLIRLWVKSFYFSIIKKTQQLSATTPPFGYPLNYLESLCRHSKFSISCPRLIFPDSSFKTGIPCWIQTLPFRSWLYSVLVIFPCLCLLFIHLVQLTEMLSTYIPHCSFPENVYIFASWNLICPARKFKCNTVCKLNPGSLKILFCISYYVTYPKLAYISIQQIFTSLTEFYLPEGHYLI